MDCKTLTTMALENLFEDVDICINDWKVENFSAGNVYPFTERLKLEDKYWPITSITEKFNRQSVSYQLSKKDSLHRWLKYKEGFSAELVEMLIDEFNIPKGGTILDPFLGSGTTALVSCIKGINSIGFDILPMSEIAIKAKLSLYLYNVEELNALLHEIRRINVPNNYKECTPYISITKQGYPQKTSEEISYYTQYFNKSNYSVETKNLVTLCILNSLERISYSAKDGQYLRWDYRCPKIIEAEKARLAAGKKPFVVKLDKGKLPSLKEVLEEELSIVIADITTLKSQNEGFNDDITCQFIYGSALFEMPKMKPNIINGVITSPPYCNRYDYTRTYAMELAYLGVSEVEIKNLRQELLSCTVENKTKIDRLREFYKSIDREGDFENILHIVEQNKTLKEINSALEQRNANGEINNKGILKMVNGYFTELTFIFAELYRLCKKGSYVAFVNDNVRYAGEVIPVDFLTTEFAEQLGFKPIKIYTLKQKKGNSSQQMKKYGRVALRKSITIWQKI